MRSSRARPVAPAQAAAAARRQLTAMARPAGEFDASRYFRGADNLGFYNVGAAVVRRMGKACAAEHKADWTVADAVAFAEPLMRDRYLDVKALGIETLACFHKQFTARQLPLWKRWLANDHASNWATTDAMCGMLLGPLLVRHPDLIPQLFVWSTHQSLWVRRASIVALLMPVRRGLALDQLYATAVRLHPDPADLIHKAVGWALREAGKIDAARLETYLRDQGASIPRTTVRYAIERFPEAKRRVLLAATRATKMAATPARP